MIAERPATLAARDGIALEGRVAVPAGARAGVVVCHPHPLYGGALDNPVVTHIVAACGNAGLATLRFNFRGVGASDGEHDGGIAERGDVLGALDHLAGLLPEGRLALAGYSFGAAVAAGVAAGEVRLAGVALIAPPLAIAGEPLLAPLAAFAGRLLIVAGSDDDYCPAAMLTAAASTLPGAHVQLVPDADHFFGRHGRALGAAVAAWAAALLEAGQPGGRGGAR